jgi:hypothetical protein
MVNDFAFCAPAPRAMARSAAPASIFIDDRRSVMRNLSPQVLRLKSEGTNDDKVENPVEASRPHAQSPSVAARLIPCSWSTGAPDQPFPHESTYERGAASYLAAN